MDQVTETKAPSFAEVVSGGGSAPREPEPIPDSHRVAARRLKALLADGTEDDLARFLGKLKDLL